MYAPRLTQKAIQVDRRPQFLALKQDALGVFIGSDKEVVQVVLRVDAGMAPYIRTVPVHQSQTIIAENGRSMTVSLRIIINPELESAILGYGEHVEVVEPTVLRDKIKRRAHSILQKHSHL